jgi:uncharacterized protein YdaU (DUF1376 family)
MSRPWMPLYIADYIKDTSHLRALESGAYLHLIMAYWVSGKLPNDDRQLATIAKLTDKEWRACKGVLAEFFGPDWSSHKRIDRELAETAKRGEALSEKARFAANKRWAKHAPSMPQACPEQSPSNAPRCTLHTSQRKKEDTTTPYAFESGVIRLNETDFNRWKEAFSNLDLRAELVGLTEWAASQKNWFNAVSGALTKRNREIHTRKTSPPSAKVLSPFGTEYPDGII